MTIAYWMLIAAVMMPYLTIALAKSPGGIDNRAPRPSLESLSGWRQRADRAHRNHFEAFRAFARDLYGTVRSGSGHSAIDRLVAWPDRYYLAVRARRLSIEGRLTDRDTDPARDSRRAGRKRKSRVGLTGHSPLRK
jgi:uncharacterized MAPEG superfamily protein